MNFELLEEKILKLDKKVDELTFLRQENFEREDILSNELETLNKDIDLQTKVSSLFKHLLDTLLEEKKQEIQKLVTFGLKTVFTDQELVFRIYMEHKYNTICTTFKTEKVGITEGSVLENFGGGVVNIESFLLRVVTLFQTGLKPFLFLDETFPHLMGDEYQENCSFLIKKLCKEMGITIFAVTQKDNLINNADKAYRALSSDQTLKDKLKLEEITKKNDT